MIKLLSSEVAAPEPWGQVMERVGRLGSPHLPRLVDLGEVAGGPRWLAFEAVEGRSLADWLEGHANAGTSPGLGVALRLFDAICRAVQLGHAASGREAVLHRGLSPASVILQAHSGGHRVRVLDHEVVPFLGVVASREHMAPEQHDAPGRETPATDVFSLAVLFAQLISMRATPRATPGDVWWALAQREPEQIARRLQDVRQDVPLALWQVIARAMHPDPGRRFGDAQTFARVLRQNIPSAWKRLPAVEREPPTPSLKRASASVSPAPRRESTPPPVGWIDAERAPPEARLPADFAEGAPARAAEWTTPSAPTPRPLDAARVVALVDPDEIVPASADEGEATLLDARRSEEEGEATVRELIVDRAEPSSKHFDVARESAGHGAESSPASSSRPLRAHADQFTLSHDDLPHVPDDGKLFPMTLRPGFKAPPVVPPVNDERTVPMGTAASQGTMVPMRRGDRADPSTDAGRTGRLEDTSPGERRLPPTWIVVAVGVLLVSLTIALLSR